MTFEIAITFIVYLLFFAWIGYRRGFRAELIVFMVAFFSWIGLELFGDVVVQLANFGGKFLAFVASGGLGSGGDAAIDALKTAPDIITPENQDSFLFVIWVILVVLAYIFSSPVPGRRRAAEAVAEAPVVLVSNLTGLLSGQSRSGSVPSDARLRGWAVLIGIANGLLYASVFLPRLMALLFPEATAYFEIPKGAGPLQLFVTGMKVVIDSIEQLWRLAGPYGPLIVLVMVTLLLLIAAGTLRKGSSSGNGSANARS